MTQESERAGLKEQWIMFYKPWQWGRERKCWKESWSTVSIYLSIYIHTHAEKKTDRPVKTKIWCRSDNDILIYSDIAAWPVLVPDDLRINLVKRGSEPLLTKDEPFQFNEKGRNTRRYGQHTTWFYRYVSNVKKIEDVVYSKSKIYLFCFYVSADYLQILRQTWNI